MLFTSIDAQLFHLLTAETRFGHHPFDRMSSRIYSGLRAIIGSVGGLFNAADIAGIASVDFASLFHPGHFDFVGIDDDDAIAAIHMRSEIGAMLSSQDFRHFCGKSAQGFTSRIELQPLAGVYSLLAWLKE